MSKEYNGRDAGLLRPCPFCGGKPKLIEGDLGHGFWIECEDCLAGTRVCSKREVVKLWNHRDKDTQSDSTKLEEFADKIYELLKRRKEESENA